MKSLERVSEFRTISLCNDNYKLISKILTNRLRRFLLKMIGESQSFLCVEQIDYTQCHLGGIEALHSMKIVRDI